MAPRNDKYIQVLWVENDPIILKSFPREAGMNFNLQLDPYDCWEDAETALLDDYDRWDALILDAKCKYKKNDIDRADKFVARVFVRLLTIFNQKKPIPWYVLSGQAEDDINDLINEGNDGWDKEWIDKTGKRFYSKASTINWNGREEYERRILFQRLKDNVEQNSKYQIRNHLCRDVFDAIKEIGLAEKLESALISLLEPIHFSAPNSENNLAYNNCFDTLRIAIEYIFYHMVGRGILPFEDNPHNPYRKIILEECSIFLGSERPNKDGNLKNGRSPGNSEKRFWKKCKRESQDPILPQQLGDWLKSALHQVGNRVHTQRGETEGVMNYDRYLLQVGGSPYMLRSLAYGLCDFILWYRYYLAMNSDYDVNRAKWKLISIDSQRKH